MRHYNNLKMSDLNKLCTGEHFTYLDHHTGLYKKGVKVSAGYMVPIGLLCNTIESARKQS